MNIDDLTNDQGLMVRSFPIRSKDTAKREFTGIGVPYGETYDSGWGWRERFEPGAIDPNDGAKIFWQHREVIGTVTAARETDAGYEVTGKISDTVLGRDALTLLSDGAVDSLSIGFQPVEYRTEKADDGTETIIHTKVRAREFSLVNFPAYESAKVSSIRSAPEKKDTPVDPVTDTLTRADLAPVNEGLEELTRSVARLEAGNGLPAGNPIPEFRSIGAFVKAVAAGDESALNLHRDFVGGQLADAIVKDSWIGEYFKLIEERRRTVNTFGVKSLPATGMTVEYAKIKAGSDTTRVAEQVNEGDMLAGPGRIAFETASAPVHTVGGWTELSFQAVQRATISTADTLWKAMLLKYARGTELRVLAEYFKVMDDRVAASVLDPEADTVLSLSAEADANDWLDTIVDAALIYEERGFALEGMHASVDQFKRLNRLTDGDGRRLMNVFGSGVNQVGELDLSTIDGTLAKLPVKLIGNRKTRNRLAFYDSVAIETLESPGAPLQLQDENIINLTKQLSLYGYIAVTTPFPEAILPVTVTA